MNADLQDKVKSQEHILKNFERLLDWQKAQLLHQIDEIDFDYLESAYKSTLIANTGNFDEDIEPPKDEVCGSWKDLLKNPSLHDEYMRLSYQAINSNKVACLLLAGGQGTRLGVTFPKGMYSVNLPSRKTLFQIQAERLISLINLVQAKLGGKRPVIPWYIMTSEHTQTETEQFFQENKYFGYDSANVIFFEQHTIPCIDFEGKIIMHSPECIATSPDGNGGLYRTLREKSILEDMRRRGVEYVQTYCVDNILVKIADPDFIGFCLGKGCECAAKVVEKVNPSEPIGVVALHKNKYKVIEYSEISKEKASALASEGTFNDQAGDLNGASKKLLYRSGNICIHFMTLTFLEKVCTPAYEMKLPYHVARKKIPFWDEKKRQTVKPEDNNGIKLEKFIFDVFPFAETFGIWEVNRAEEFAPLKNGPGAQIDCPSTCQQSLLSMDKQRAVEAGAKLTDSDAIVEISPLTSLNGENLEFLNGTQLDGICYIHPTSSEQSRKSSIITKIYCWDQQ